MPLASKRQTQDDCDVRVPKALCTAAQASVPVRIPPCVTGCAQQSAGAANLAKLGSALSLGRELWPLSAGKGLCSSPTCWVTCYTATTCLSVASGARSFVCFESPIAAGLSVHLAAAKFTSRGMRVAVRGLDRFCGCMLAVERGVHCVAQFVHPPHLLAYT